jgi:hypothetical protein
VTPGGGHPEPFAAVIPSEARDLSLDKPRLRTGSARDLSLVARKESSKA